MRVVRRRALRQQAQRKNALRHADNLTEITTITGDYDAEQVPLEQARERLEVLGVRPRSTPRLRIRPTSPAGVVAPLAQATTTGPLQTPHRPPERGAGRILASESWSLSQSFYFGPVNGHEYLCADSVGRCIDETPNSMI
ncbi:MAG: hypothetical protein IPF60_16190 [Betaproteobacteria bacterium]|nr:hypothetical protein [Betaproteobacteria bacterium]